MLWEFSWDQNNIIDGSRYSDHVFALLKDTLEVHPVVATTSPGQGTAQGTSVANTNHTKCIFNLGEGIEREIVLMHKIMTTKCCKCFSFPNK